MFDFLPTPFPWPTVVSASLSIILSFGGFVIGIRAGKNNRDRGYLRDIYKNLFTHLRELKESIENGTPKQWESYRTQGGKYIPPIKSLEQDGTINALPDRLARDLLEVEKTTLFNNWQWKKMIEDSVSPEIRSTFLNSIDGDGKSRSGGSYRPIRLSKMMMLNDEEFSKSLNGLDDGTHGLGLELTMVSNRTDTLYAYSDSLKSGSLSELAQKVRKESLSTEEAKGLTEIHTKNSKSWTA